MRSTANQKRPFHQLLEDDCCMRNDAFLLTSGGCSILFSGGIGPRVLTANISGDQGGTGSGDIDNEDKITCQQQQQLMTPSRVLPYYYLYQASETPFGTTSRSCDDTNTSPPPPPKHHPIDDPNKQLLSCFSEWSDESLTCQDNSHTQQQLSSDDHSSYQQQTSSIFSSPPTNALHEVPDPPRPDFHINTPELERVSFESNDAALALIEMASCGDQLSTNISSSDFLFETAAAKVHEEQSMDASCKDSGTESETFDNPDGLISNLPPEMRHITTNALAEAMLGKLLPVPQSVDREDLYTPRWVRGKGKHKEGLCLLCPRPGWYKMKCSNYWYHMIFYHGISSQTGRPFDPPLKTRKENGNIQQGLCRNCNRWITLQSPNNPHFDMNWRKHCQKCLK